MTDPRWKTFLCHALILPVILLVLSSCHSAQENTSSMSASGGSMAGPQYVRHQEGNEGVIVFVHGVLGGGRGTWTNSSTKAYWPELLTKDRIFNGFDVYVYEYGTPLFKSALTTAEVAEDMRATFDGDDIFKHKEVIFLCHSMGGLTTRSFLQKYQRYATQVGYLYFFSTPTEGSGIAAVAKIFSRNPQFGRMVPIDRDSSLADQILAWNAAQFQIPSYCAYETEPTFGLTVVKFDSAVALCNKPLTPVAANHIEIVKPKDDRDKPYVLFKNAFRQTRPVIGINLPQGLTLKQAIELVVQSDKSDGGSFQTFFADCDDALLSATIRGGKLRAGTMEALIGSIGRRVQDIKVTPLLTVTRDQEKGRYDVRCEK